MTRPDARPGQAEDQVLYLSTLAFPEEWLNDLRSVSSRVQVVQRTCQAPAEIADEIWREVQVLHTSQVFPEPSQAPNLAWVQLDTSGVDHVAGLPIWQQTDVPVTTIRGVSARWSAEYILMMLLAFSHRLPRILDGQRRHSWPGAADRWRSFMPAPLSGTTIVIIGFGRIGRATGALCSALGMHVIGVRSGADLGAGPAGPAQGAPGAGAAAGSVTEAPAEALRDVLPGADYVVVTVPLTPHTLGLLDRPAVKSLKPGSVLVNVSRGGVVDEAAVAELLRDGHLAAAAFDVFGQEPLPEDDPLWEVPNLIITPHVAGFAGDYAEQVKALVVENLRRFMSGDPLLNVASRVRGY